MPMTVDDLVTMPIASLTSRYQSGEVDPVDVITTTLDQISAVNPRLRALYDVRTDEVLDEAAAARDRYRAGAPRGPLDGVPVTIKDSVHAVGMR